MEKVFEALDKLEECANGMKDLPKSNWIDLAENEAELDLKIMDWVEAIKFELFKGKQALTELKAIKEAKPSEELKDLQVIENNIVYLLSDCDTNDEVEQCLKDVKTRISTIKQALLKAQEQDKVLEIIKEKGVILSILEYSQTVEDYNNAILFSFKPSAYEMCKLTKEEFNLLKRWSENDN